MFIRLPFPVKKVLLSCLLVTVFVSCKTPQNTLTKDAEGNLLGIVNKDHFLEAPYQEWFAFSYDDYTVNTGLAKSLEPALKNIRIKAFMGTWCGDSQEQVPVFYKILEAAAFDFDRLEMVAVDLRKSTPDLLEKGFDIQRVPTLIFFEKGREIGRFVEYPMESMEEDLLKIASKQPYKHAYE